MKRCFLGILFFAMVLAPLSQVYSASNGTILPPAPNSTWEPGLTYQVLCISPPLANQSCNVILLQNGNTLANLGQATVDAAGMGTFKWAIPVNQARGGGYQIRFVNRSSTITVDSGTFNIGTVQRSIKLIMPAGITQAKAGDTVMLTWTYTGHTGSVSEDENRVLPTFCGYSHYQTVPIGSNGSGSFAYKIPSDFKDTQGAGFTVCWRPHWKESGNPGAVCTSTNAFHLINDAQREAAGYIDVLTPSEGQIVNVGSVVPINWKHANWMSGQVNIYLGYDTPIALNVPIGPNGSGSYSWKVTELPRWTNPVFYISIETVAKTHKGTSRNFTIKCTQPGISVLSPAANDTWVAGTTRDISWQTGLPASTPFDIELVDKYTNQNIRTIYTGLTAVQQGGVLTWGWSIPATFPTGNYAIRISRSNSGGCPATSQPFTLASPGWILLYTPGTGVSVVQNQDLYISWATKVPYNNMYVKIDLYCAGKKVTTIAPAVLHPSGNGQSSYKWTVPTSVPPGSGYYIVLEISGLNSVPVRSSDPMDTKQSFFTINAAPITPVYTPAPAIGTMPPK